MKCYAKVFVLDAPYHIDRMYTYFIPAEYNGLSEGDFVTVPFGPSNRRMSALVAELCDECPFENPKPVLSLQSDRFSLTGEQVELCLFLKDYTLCTMGEAVRTVLPSDAFAKLTEYFTAVKNSASSPSGRECAVLDYIRSHERISLKKIKEELGEQATELLSSLCRKGLVIRDYEQKEKDGGKYRVYIRLSDSLSAQEAELIAAGMPGAKEKLRSAAHREIIGLLLKEGRLEKKELLSLCGASAAQLKSLLQKELILEEKETDWRNPYADIKVEPAKKNLLSDAQREAFIRLRALYRENAPRAALLFGITGSGKTRVMKQMIDEVTSGGRGVIVLVPEISLTPQTVSIFCSFYGERVAVLHSALSAGERFDAYRRIQNGSVDVVIGTRSAIFAPLANLGMVIIDEEQEHTYKSDSDPKYHARDIARFRCKQSGALMLLASATPSVESFYKAKTGSYTLVELKERYGGAKLPDVYITDMREELRCGHTSPLSRLLAAKLAENTEKNQQSIVFLNRRGYNNFITCKECGEVIQCKRCSVALTLHKNRLGADTLVCHYCGARQSVPEKCPSCGSLHLSRVGCGTQKAEQEISRYVPEARVMRMDADTTGTKRSYDRLLNDFRDKKADILLGTQMVTKGHDFPFVTLVGVLSADASLHVGDYRASEKTFSLITQVVGRAGRAKLPGIAVVQTMRTENEALQLACRGDYNEFYEKEIILRRTFTWPPFCDVVLLTITSADEGDVRRAAEQLLKIFKEEAEKTCAGLPMIAYGPFEAPIYRLNDKYRMRMVVKCKMCERMRSLFSILLCRFGAGAREVLLSLDINPSAL